VGEEEDEKVGVVEAAVSNWDDGDRGWALWLDGVVVGAGAIVGVAER